MVYSASDYLSQILCDLVATTIARSLHHALKFRASLAAPPLRPNHTATIAITMQREHIPLFELLHTEYAHAHLTNRMRSLCILIVIAAVGDQAFSKPSFIKQS